MNPYTRIFWILKVFGMLLLTGSTIAFAPHPILSRRRDGPTIGTSAPTKTSPFLTTQSSSSTATTTMARSHNNKICTSKTRLHMYNLPPGRNEKNDLSDLLKLAGTLILTVAFFVSPLGGILLGILNSFFLLTILLPIMGGVGIAVWQYFNTMTGDCPNCGAPVRVLKSKDGSAEPSICFTCGAILQANYDNSGIDNITGRNTLEDLSRGSSSPFGGGLFDIFGGAPPTSISTTTTTTTVTQEERGNQKSKIRRESTIIDVEVDDDEPWQ